LHVLKKRVFFHKVGEEVKLNKEIHLAYKILKKLKQNETSKKVDSNTRSDLTPVEREEEHSKK
jgi:hypothetical protein